MNQYTNKDILVAFSGGVDSSLLLKLACVSAEKTGTKVYAVTLHTILHSTAELDNAKKVAEEVGAIHYILTGIIHIIDHSVYSDLGLLLFHSCIVPNNSFAFIGVPEAVINYVVRNTKFRSELSKSLSCGVIN